MPKGYFPETTVADVRRWGLELDTKEHKRPVENEWGGSIQCLVGSSRANRITEIRDTTGNRDVCAHDDHVARKIDAGTGDIDGSRADRRAERLERV